jgi:mannose-1-phosphate guanylyltransferase
MDAQVWTIVLAAGAGRRLAGITGDVPKQYWRPGGGGSLLDETRDRFAPISPPSRTVVIVDRRHVRYLPEGRAGSGRGETIVLQPEDRGTAAGVLLALTPVLDRDPEALVVITPSDQGIRDVARFRRCVIEAVERARAGVGPILFGVEPVRAEDDYGWITPEASAARGPLRRVTSFVEKPARDTAARLFAAGAVWNTMILVARAGALRDLYRRQLPDLAARFDELRPYSAGDRATRIEATYRHWPVYDFSRDLLTNAPMMWTYVLPASIGWTDLGTPQRLREWYARAGQPLALAPASMSVA